LFFKTIINNVNMRKKLKRFLQNKKVKAFTLIEILIVITIIAIIVTAIIILVRPGQKLAEARDAGREGHIDGLQSAIYVYRVDHGEYPVNIPNYLTDGEKEVCNTNIIDEEDEATVCAAADLVDISILVEEGYLAAIPVDPLGGIEETYGTGYLVAYGSIILRAPNAETRIISRGNIPAVVAQLTATADPVNQKVTLNWNGYSGGLETYNVYRKESSGAEYGEALITLTDAGYEVEYDDEDVVSGTTYYYIVTQMLDAGRESAESNEASVLFAYSDSPSGYAWGDFTGWVQYVPDDEQAWGIDIDPSTGNMSGYMWSDNIGWISLNEDGPYPTTPENSVVLSFSTYKVTGWAKAMTTGEWILFGPIDVEGTDYGVYIENDEYKGWAWGGDTIGWISFSCENTDTCATSQY
jgi:prepilin-type N-terminal cleavage/methylation domain-containing protein